MTSEAGNNSHQQVDAERFCELLEKICERVKDYFAKLTMDSTVEVAIRLPVESRTASASPKIVYSTVARSSGLNSARSKTTEDIAANEGIPRFLIERGKSQGILIYNDIKKAAELGVFKLTKNENIYPDDIVTMMVAPLNAWDGKRQSMIGLLYVTSREKSIFEAKHVDSMGLIADTVACSIALVVERLKACRRMPALGRR